MLPKKWMVKKKKTKRRDSCFLAGRVDAAARVVKMIDGWAHWKIKCNKKARRILLLFVSTFVTADQLRVGFSNALLCIHTTVDSFERGQNEHFGWASVSRPNLSRGATL